VMALMFELNREAGTTLVMVTHDLAIAERCERQLRIEAGRLVDALRPAAAPSSAHA
jgi:putative ABC transport system ATP-binding protein